MFKRFLMAMVVSASVAALSGCAVLCPTCESEAEAVASTAAPVATAAATTAAVTPVQAVEEVMDDGIVYFDFDKYSIKEEYRSVLAEKARYLKSHPNVRVRIEGNCDARGTQEYNLALGERRAQAAYEYMVMLGVDPSQLEVISYGKERPAVAGDTTKAWAKNRRDEFSIVAR